MVAPACIDESIASPAPEGPIRTTSERAGMETWTGWGPVNNSSLIVCIAGVVRGATRRLPQRSCSHDSRRISYLSV